MTDHMLNQAIEDATEGEKRLYKAWELPSKPAGRQVANKSARQPRPACSESWIFDRLKFAFPSPTFVLLPQVRSCTGDAQEKPRRVDALAVSVFPSRGLYLAGIEIKVTKTDFRKELRDPEKSEPIAQFCKYYYIAAPVNVVPIGELPERWGLIEVRADGATIVHRAEPREVVEPPDIGFMCSVLRSASRLSEPREDSDNEKAVCGDDRQP